MSERASGGRLYKAAVATTALPLIAIGSTAAAAPAVAAPTVSPAKQPTAGNIAAAQASIEASLSVAPQSVTELPTSLTLAQAPAKAKVKVHTVKRGDTLSHIALKYRVPLKSVLTWNNLKATDTIFPGDKIKVSGSAGTTKKASTAKTSSSSSSKASTYTVKAGDYLGKIAAQHGTTAAAIANANGISVNSIIYPGQKLKLSGSASSASSAPAKSSASSKKSTSTAKASSYTVKSGDTLSGIAARHGVSLNTVLKANNLQVSSIIYPGQKLKLSGSATKSTASAPAKKSSGSGSSKASTYTVKAGDYLGKIASQHGTTAAAIAKANGISVNSTIYPGQKLKLSGNASTSSAKSSSGSAKTSSAPAKSTASTYTVKAGDYLGKIASQHGTTAAAIAKANGISVNSTIYPGQKLKLSGNASTSTAKTSGGSTKTASTPAKSTASTYKVKSGDTLSGIAARHGTTAAALAAANGMSVNSTIYAGQTLKVSGSSASSNGTSTASTPSSGGSGSCSGNSIKNNFPGWSYSNATIQAANQSKCTLTSRSMPSPQQVQQMVHNTAVQMGVDPRLAKAHAMVESGFDATAVSPANAIGTMQVIPSSGEWASQLVGRKLDLYDPQDNITAGVAIIRHLQRNGQLDNGIAGYYQGEAGVKRNGMYEDTKRYVNTVKSWMNRF